MGSVFQTSSACCKQDGVQNLDVIEAVEGVDYLIHKNVVQVRVPVGLGVDYLSPKTGENFPINERPMGKQEYAHWIKARIEDIGMVKGVDYTDHKFVVGRATQIDYLVTPDMAKELGMLERNERGLGTARRQTSVPM